MLRHFVFREPSGGFVYYDLSDSSAEIEICGKGFRRLYGIDLSLYEFLRESGFDSRYAAMIVSGFENRKKISGMPLLMGVVNATPDSFYPASRISENERLLDRMIDAKPDIIDIGGESSRPGSHVIGADDEIKRIRPVVQYLSSVTDIPLSIDTYHPETVEAMLDYGIGYINDISGFSDSRMRAIASESRLKCIVMHMRGDHSNMQTLTEYRNLVAEINGFFYSRLLDMQHSGIDPEMVILDPGIGFSKKFSGNVEILRSIDSFRIGFPLLVGTSRKSWIGNITGEDVFHRLPGTIASSIYLQMHGVDILRVHDVSENRSALMVFRELNGST